MATRKILAIIIALAVVLGGVLCLSGCSKEKEIEEHTESEFGGLVAISLQEGFIKGKTYNQYILYDPDTLVMYTLIVAPNKSNVTLSVLYNADGTPKLYNPDK